jgi:hypothetical protein
MMVMAMADIWAIFDWRDGRMGGWRGGGVGGVGGGEGSLG